MKTVKISNELLSRMRIEAKRESSLFSFGYPAIEGDGVVAIFLETPTMKVSALDRGVATSRMRAPINSPVTIWRPSDQVARNRTAC